MKKRVLWLLNHATLQEFEVPLLVELGYEVFTPKQYTIGYGDMSAACTYEYDKTLSIDKSILSKLNSVDFFHNISNEVMQLINEYFDIAFCMFVTDQAKMFAKYFHGQILLRWFGALYETSYTELLNRCDTLELFRECGNRFWFATGYPNLHEIECDFLKKRTLYLPLGLKDATPKRIWVGGDQRMLFVCPKINTDPYYAELYENFKQNFKDFPYLIGGHQLQPVFNDDKVCGYLPKEGYEYNMAHLACMYYHSSERYHLHYHPLEAVKVGMPLVFMSGGMLDVLGGRESLGRCESLKEAKNKIKRILNHDTRLISNIINSQEKLLEQFDVEKCKKYWKEALARVERSIEFHEKNLRRKTKKKLGLILPLPYTGGVLDVAKRFTLALQQGIEKNDAPVKLVFGYPKDRTLMDKEEILILKEKGIECREFTAIDITGKEIRTIQKLRGFASPQGREMASWNGGCILDDDAHEFEDCDYLIYIADRSGGNYPVFTERPYAMIVHDCIQRYMPESIPPIYGSMIVESYRRADHLFALSIPTMEDCIHYGNLQKEKVSILPLMYDMLLPSIRNEKESMDAMNATKNTYFLWSTNLSPHKNHIRAFEALAKYYERGGNLDCFITGIGTQNLDPDYAKEHSFASNSHIDFVHYVIRKNPILKKHIHFVGNLPKEEYIILLKNARFFFHPGYADNGNMSFFDAACLGVPSISNDYPAMRYCSKFCGVPVRFMNAFSIHEIVEGVEEMEQKANEFAASIPKPEDLNKATINNTWQQIYDAIKAVVGF